MPRRKALPIYLSSDDDDFAESLHQSLSANSDDSLSPKNPPPPSNNLKDNDFYQNRKVEISRQRQYSMKHAALRSKGGKMVRKRLSFGHIAVLTLFVGLAIGLVLSGVGLAMRPRTLSGNLLDCDQKDKLPIDEYCVEANHTKALTGIILSLAKNLTSSQGVVDCGWNTSEPMNMTFRELKGRVAAMKLSGEIENVSSRDLSESLVHLLLKNPLWGLSLVNGSGNLISSWPSKTMDDIIIVPNTSDMGLLCRVTAAVSFLWRWMKWLLVGSVILIVGFVLLRWYIKKKEKDVLAMFMLVDRILEVLRRHYDEAKKDSNVLPFLAILHVRDMLIPPPERMKKQKTWSKAVEWLAVHESRVRVENRKIAGEEFTVWRWIQIGPPSTDNPAYLVREKNWQGSAIDEYPPALCAKIAPPTGQPSKCIRLKNMFEGVRKLDSEQAQDIESSVLDRCIPNGGVVHIKVDKRSPYGCVYFKMDSLISAAKIYKALHGGWFKGKLITAKYIPEPKYHRWFPDSAAAKKFLYPPD